MYRDDANGIKLKEIVIIIKNTIITSFLFFISPQASGECHYYAGGFSEWKWKRELRIGRIGERSEDEGDSRK